MQHKTNTIQTYSLPRIFAFISLIVVILWLAGVVSGDQLLSGAANMPGYIFNRTLGYAVLPAAVGLLGFSKNVTEHPRIFFMLVFFTGAICVAFGMFFDVLGYLDCGDECVDGITTASASAQTARYAASFNLILPGIFFILSFFHPKQKQD
jgi:hypothetical protein